MFYYEEEEEERDFSMEYRELRTQLKSLGNSLQDLNDYLKDIRSLVTSSLSVNNQVIHQEEFEQLSHEVQSIAHDLRANVIPMVNNKT